MAKYHNDALTKTETLIHITPNMTLPKHNINDIICLIKNNITDIGVIFRNNNTKCFIINDIMRSSNGQLIYIVYSVLYIENKFWYIPSDLTLSNIDKYTNNINKKKLIENNIEDTENYLKMTNITNLLYLNQYNDIDFLSKQQYNKYL